MLSRLAIDVYRHEHSTKLTPLARRRIQDLESFQEAATYTIEEARRREHCETSEDSTAVGKAKLVQDIVNYRGRPRGRVRV